MAEIIARLAPISVPCSQHHSATVIFLHGSGLVNFVSSVIGGFAAADLVEWVIM